MNDNENGTKKFEATKTSSDTSAKKSPLDLKKIVKLSIFAATIIILVLFCAIIITEIAYKVGGSDSPNKKIKYTDITLASSDFKKGTLLIINKTYPIGSEAKSESETKVQVVQSYNSTNSIPVYYGLPQNTVSLIPETISAFNRMIEDLHTATGCSDILLAYGYLVPKSYTIECDYPHELGTVVDIKINNVNGTYPLSSNEAAMNWLNTNSAKYGFINSDPAGNLHIDPAEYVTSTQFRYVGVAHASYIAKNNMLLDSYVDLLKNSHASYENALNFKGVDGNSYAVYYVTASNDQYTTLTVPENASYTVSGDNIGGFIVTVNLSE